AAAEEVPGELRRIACGAPHQARADALAGAQRTFHVADLRVRDSRLCLALTPDAARRVRGFGRPLRGDGATATGTRSNREIDCSAHLVGCLIGRQNEIRSDYCRIVETRSRDRLLESDIGVFVCCFGWHSPATHRDEMALC